MSSQSLTRERPTPMTRCSFSPIKDQYTHTHTHTHTGMVRQKHTQTRIWPVKKDCKSMQCRTLDAWIWLRSIGCKAVWLYRVSLLLGQPIPHALEVGQPRREELILNDYLSSVSPHMWLIISHSDPKQSAWYQKGLTADPFTFDEKRKYLNHSDTNRIMKRPHGEEWKMKRFLTFITKLVCMERWGENNCEDKQMWIHHKGAHLIHAVQAESHTACRRVSVRSSPPPPSNLSRSAKSCFRDNLNFCIIGVGQQPEPVR